MSATVLLLTALVVWCAIGIVVSIWMRRRGHALFMWAYLGAVLGPLVIPLALEAIFSERVVGIRRTASFTIGPWETRRSRRRRRVVRVRGRGACRRRPPGGPHRPDDPCGGRRLRQRAVVDYDSAGYSVSERRRAAEAHLDSAARAVAFENPEREILVGSPADALERAAHEGGFDLLVVGHRGRGASRALLGSVTSRLASGPDVPILIGAKPAAAATDHSAGERGEHGRGRGIDR